MLRILQHFKEMFKTLRNEIKTVDIIAEHGIRPLIKVHKNVSSMAKISPFRRMIVIEQRAPEWNKRDGYH